MPSSPEYNRAYYEKHKDRLKAAARLRSVKRRLEKPEECKAAVRAWFANPEKLEHIRAYARAYSKGDTFKRIQAAFRARHPERMAERGRKWRQANPGRVAAKTRGRTASKGNRTPAWVGPDERWMINEVYELCALRSAMTGVKHHVDHIIPLNGKTVSGLHVPTNLRVIPAYENLRKGHSFAHSA